MVVIYHSVLERIWVKGSYQSQWLPQGERGPPTESKSLWIEIRLRAKILSAFGNRLELDLDYDKDGTDNWINIADTLISNNLAAPCKVCKLQAPVRSYWIGYLWKVVPCPHHWSDWGVWWIHQWLCWSWKNSRILRRLWTVSHCGYDFYSWNQTSLSAATFSGSWVFPRQGYAYKKRA